VWTGLSPPSARQSKKQEVKDLQHEDRHRDPVPLGYRPCFAVWAAIPLGLQAQRHHRLLVIFGAEQSPCPVSVLNIVRLLLSPPYSAAYLPSSAAEAVTLP
jgi:hypothetical protein